MARKSAPAKAAAKAAPKVAARKPVASTPVRNTAIPKIAAPKVTAAAAKVITHDLIATRAYEIFRSGNGGSDLDNWFAAERELRGA